MRAAIFLFFISLSTCFGGIVFEQYADTQKISLPQSNTVIHGGSVILSNQPISIQVSSTDFAKGCSAYCSSTNGTNRSPGFVCDTNTNRNNTTGTRWESAWAVGEFAQEWLYVDLGLKRTFSAVSIAWEGAYAKVYTIQVSDDHLNWTTVSSNTNGSVGWNDLHFPVQTGRYVRVYCYRKALPVNGYSIYIMRVYMGWYNKITASSENGANTAGNSVDGDTGTRWESLQTSQGGANDQWLAIDFGVPKQFNLMTIKWENAFARSYKLQISDNGVDWNTIFMWTGRSGGQETNKLANLNTRYFRIYCYEKGLPGVGYSIWEMAFFSSQYTNAGSVTSVQYSPPHFSAWKKFYCNTTIPQSCNVNVVFLNSGGVPQLVGGFSSTALSSGFNAIDISSIPPTTSTISVKFILTSPLYKYSTPVIDDYVLSWDTSTNYLKLLDLKLTAQNSKVTADGLSQQHAITLKWGNSSGISKFGLWRGLGSFDQDSFIKGMAASSSAALVTTLNSNIRTYVDTITNIDNDGYYVLQTSDKNGYGELSNPVKIISYPVTEQQGWVWLPSNWLWREGEEWDSKDTPGAIEYRSTASAGACLGSSWGSWVIYNIYIDQTMSAANLYLRYASMGPHQMDIYVDDVKLYSAFQFLDTLDWGIFTFSSVSLGALSAGKHAIKLNAIGNFNFDGFYIYDGSFNPNNVLVDGLLVPPSPWKQRKISITELPNLTALQAFDAKNNPMINNPALIKGATYSIEGFDSVFFIRLNLSASILQLRISLQEYPLISSLSFHGTANIGLKWAAILNIHRAATL